MGDFPVTMAPPSLKKLIVLGACVAGLNATQLFGALLVEETFDYTVGQSIGGKSGGSGFTGSKWNFGSNGTGTMKVAENGVAVTGTQDTWATRGVSISAEDAPVIYFSYQVTPAEMAGIESGSLTDAIILKAPNKPVVVWAGVTYLPSGLNLKAQVNGTDYVLRNNSQMSVGATYTIVGRLTFDNGNGQAALSLWVNPENEDTPATLSRTWASEVTSISQVLVQRYDGGGRGVGYTTVFDDIRIATDWHSALGISAPIPEPSSVAVLAGAAGLAFASSRRRRR